MTDTTKFPAQNRVLFGKKVEQLRRAGLLPANVFGVNKESKAIVFSSKNFEKLYEKAGETGLIYLQIEGDKNDLPVLVDEVQYHPVTGEISHASLKQVDLSEKIMAEIPVETVGENAVPGAVVVLIKNNIEVEALPTDLPEKFELDISLLTQIGQSLSYSDLKFDATKVKLQVAEEEMASPLVLLEGLKEEVEPEVTPEEPADSAAGATNDANATAPAEEKSAADAK